MLNIYASIEEKAEDRNDAFYENMEEVYRRLNTTFYLLLNVN